MTKTAPFGDDAIVHEDATIVRRGRAVPCFKDKKTGYWLTAVKLDNKIRTMLLHRVVCVAFHGPAPEDKPYVRHLDGDQDNNKASNLAWGSHRENMADRDRHNKTARGERNGTAKLSASQVVEIRELIANGMPTKDAAKLYGIRQATASQIAVGHSWRSVGGPISRRKQLVSRQAQSAMRRWEGQ